MDLLTGLDNRNSYEIRINGIDESNDNLVFGLFDLFRLKYVNDNYSHKRKSVIGVEKIKRACEENEIYQYIHGLRGLQGQEVTFNPKPRKT